MAVMRPALSMLLLLAATACASLPEGMEPSKLLDDAEVFLQQGKPSEALALLDSASDEIFAQRELERFKLLRGQALFGTGSPWSAYLQIRHFAEDHRFSDESPRVEELMFQLGKHLVNSDRSWWIFGSDEEDGEIVLTQFIERYATNGHAAEALKLLGGIAYQEKRYLIAKDRYKQIMTHHPRSEWAPLAHHRIALSSYLSLEGPEYDLESMSLTRNELRDYLEIAPERPEYRKSASDALATVEHWIAERHWTIAEFYRTIDNRYGERMHLEAAVREYPDLKPGKMAAARLKELGPASTAVNGQ